MSGLVTSSFTAPNMSSASQRKAKLAVPASSKTPTKDVSTASFHPHLPSEILELIVDAVITEEFLTFSTGVDFVPRCPPFREINAISSLLLSSRCLRSITCFAMRGRQTFIIWDFETPAAKDALLRRLEAMPSSGPWTQDLTIRLHVQPYLINSDFRDDFECLLGHVLFVNSGKTRMLSSHWNQLDTRFHGTSAEYSYMSSFTDCAENTGLGTWDSQTLATLRKVFGCGQLERRMVFNQQLACVESRDFETTKKEEAVLDCIRRKKEYNSEKVALPMVLQSKMPVKADLPAVQSHLGSAGFSSSCLSKDNAVCTRVRKRIVT